MSLSFKSRYKLHVRLKRVPCSLAALFVSSQNRTMKYVLQSLVSLYDQRFLCVSRKLGFLVKKSVAVGKWQLLGSQSGAIKNLLDH